MIINATAEKDDGKLTGKVWLRLDAQDLILIVTLETDEYCHLYRKLYEAMDAISLMKPNSHPQEDA